MKGKPRSLPPAPGWCSTCAPRRVGVPGAEAIALEDTAHGVAAAQAAGIFAVAIPNPYVDEAEVAAADLVLGSADQVLLSELLLLASTEVIG
jgi:beta-phosphoglucomutase-like phosphatase (HAD superfamily)